MVIAVVSNDDNESSKRRITKEKFFLFCYKIATKGGFLREGNATFLIGVNDEKVPEVLDIMEKYSKTRSKIVPNAIVNEFGSFSTLPIEVSVGGATVFILNVDQFIKL